jgi:hypothetical protein
MAGAHADFANDIFSLEKGIRGPAYANNYQSRGNPAHLGFDLAHHLLYIVFMLMKDKLKLVIPVPGPNSELLTSQNKLADFLKLDGSSNVKFQNRSSIFVKNMYLGQQLYNFAKNIYRTTLASNKYMLFTLDINEIVEINRDNNLQLCGDRDIGNTYEKLDSKDGEFTEDADAWKKKDRYKETVETLYRFVDALQNKVKPYLYYKYEGGEAKIYGTKKYLDYNWYTNRNNIAIGAGQKQNDLLRYVVELSLLETNHNELFGQKIIKAIDQFTTIVYRRLSFWSGKFYNIQVFPDGNEGLLLRILGFFNQITSKKLTEPIDAEKAEIAFDIIRKRFALFESNLAKVVKLLNDKKKIDISQLGTDGDIDLSGLLGGGKKKKQSKPRLLRIEGGMEVYTFKR